MGTQNRSSRRWERRHSVGYAPDVAPLATRVMHDHTSEIAQKTVRLGRFPAPNRLHFVDELRHDTDSLSIGHRVVKYTRGHVEPFLREQRLTFGMHVLGEYLEA